MLCTPDFWREREKGKPSLHLRLRSSCQNTQGAAFALPSFCFGINKFSLSWEKKTNVSAWEDDCCDLFCCVAEELSLVPKNAKALPVWEQSTFYDLKGKKEKCENKGASQICVLHCSSFVRRNPTSHLALFRRVADDPVVRDRKSTRLNSSHL